MSLAAAHIGSCRLADLARHEEMTIVHDLMVEFFQQTEIAPRARVPGPR
jgi:hypothetical protein